MSGHWIKLYDSITEWEWFQDANTFRLFTYLLVKAAYSPFEYKGIQLEAGEYISSIPALAEKLGISVKAVRVALDHLKSTGEISVRSTNRFSVFRIENYAKYQSEMPENRGRQNSKKGQAKPEKTAGKRAGKRAGKINGESSIDKEESINGEIEKGIPDGIPDGRQNPETGQAKPEKRATEIDNKEIDYLNNNYIGQFPPETLPVEPAKKPKKDAAKKDAKQLEDAEVKAWTAQIAEYLHQKTGKVAKPTAACNLKLIRARRREGYILDDFLNVIDVKTRQWLGHPKMDQFLRFSTLFGDKMEGYLNEAITEAKKESQLYDFSWAEV